MACGLYGSLDFTKKGKATDPLDMLGVPEAKGNAIGSCARARWAHGLHTHCLWPP